MDHIASYFDKVNLKKIIKKFKIIKLSNLDPVSMWKQTMTLEILESMVYSNLV